VKRDHCQTWSPPQPSRTAKKGALATELREEIGQEVERLVTLLTPAGDGVGGLDLEVAELAIRAGMHRIGGSFLEKLLALDRGHRGPRVECGAGHEATFVNYREKYLTTVLAPVRVQRAYYHCADCHGGVVPRDDELRIAGSSLSPGVRRITARTGSQEPFAQASRDLADLAGITVPAKQVERVSEASGDRIRKAAENEWADLLAGTILPLPATPIPTLYVAVDGTGVPTVPAETEGRAGKGADGRAHTREIKLGCVFTQTKLDEDGRPVRDPDSTSYLATAESAETFGPMVYTEALRRGVQRARRVVILGDGARWIWNIAGEHFPNSIQVVDLYHAREHVGDLATLLFPTDPTERRQWREARVTELDRGDITTLLHQFRQVDCASGIADQVRKQISYFETNKTRMRYGEFRRMGIFVGSGVVEAGCRSLVHQRLKQSGMRWSLRGAQSVIWLRCHQAGGRWDEFWAAPKIA